MRHEPRTYRSIVSPQGLIHFEVVVEQTDLSIFALKAVPDVARELVLECRGMIEAYIRQFPAFAETLSPWYLHGAASPIVQEMSWAGQMAGVGPMAAVAGALAEYVGRRLLVESEEVLVENGGDIFINALRPITVGIFAGKSPLSNKVGLKITAAQQPMAVCTSSGMIGHSISLGKADAVCIVAESCALADAVATAVANRVKSKNSVPAAIAFAKRVDQIEGAVIIKDDALSVWGNLELVPIA